MSDAISPATAAMLGVPDPTGGKPVLDLSAPAVKPGDTVDLTTGTAPAYVPDRPLGQTLPSAPAPVATPAPVAEAPFTPPPPQTVATKDSRTTFESGVRSDPALVAQEHDINAQQATQAAAESRERMLAEQDAAKIERERAADAARQAQKQADLAAERQRISSEHLARIATAQKELDAHEVPTEGIGTRIGNSIAMLLGGFGEALGGHNDVPKIIEADRKQKLDVWKAQYDRLKGKVSGAQNLYALAKNKGLDDNEALLAAGQMVDQAHTANIRAIMAENKAPITQIEGKKALLALQATQVARDDARQKLAQGKATKTVDEREVTKSGGDTKEQNDAIKEALTNEDVKAYKLKKSALTRFQSFVDSGASGVALVDFVAGKGGLDQGSFGPSMVQLIHRNGWVGDKLEKLRSAWEGGADPKAIAEIKGALELDKARALVNAQPAINHYSGALRRLGVNPKVLLGGETANEQAAAAGFTAK